MYATCELAADKEETNVRGLGNFDTDQSQPPCRTHGTTPAPLDRDAAVHADGPRATAPRVLMKRLALVGLAAFALTMAASPTTAASDADYIAAGGPHVAKRAEDGTTTLELTISNLGDRRLELRL